MTHYSDEVFELTLAKQKPGYQFIEPPLLSDSKELRKKDDGVLITDMNLLSRKQGPLHILGKALYEHRTGIEKETVLLSQLPEGYVMRQNKSKRTFYITGHPGGRILDAAKFVPHLIWLEKASSECECSCTACNLPPLNPISVSIISDLPSFTHEIESCTIESFKILRSVVIEPPNDIYCKPFIVPLPAFAPSNAIIRETDTDESTC